MKKLFFIILSIVLLTCTDVNAASRVINGNDLEVFKRSKAEIQQQWEIGKLDYSQSIYDVEPSYVAPYNGGVVKQSYLNDVLDNLNYYRYLVGSPKVTNAIKNRDDLQKAVVLQYLNLTDRENGIGLSHSLSTYPKPSDMDDDFYNTAKYPLHNIISSYSYKSPVFPFFAESYFEYTSGHRTSLLSPSIYSAEFGLGNVVYGHTYGNSTNHAEMTNDFAAYPAPGYFPTHDFTWASDWDIYLNATKFAGLTTDSTKNIKATIENLTTNEIIEYSVDKGNLAASSSYTIHLVKPPIANDSYYTGSFKVTITNLKDSAGELVDITYTVNFFDKYEGQESNIETIDYNKFNYLKWEGIWDTNLIVKFLPTVADIRLDSGSAFETDITSYTFTKNDIWYVEGINYDVKPNLNNLPSYAKDGNGVLSKETIGVDHIEAANRKLIVTKNKADYGIGDEIKLTYTFNDTSASGYIYEWYNVVKDNNNYVLTKIENSTKYEINGSTLTIKDATLDDNATYYVKAIPGERMFGFADVVSLGVDIDVKIQPTAIKYTATKSTMNVENTFAFKTEISPSDATDKTVKWTSSNTNIATVDANGVVTAKNPGQVTITATTTNGIKATHTITIFSPIVSVSLNVFKKTIEIGKTLTLAALINPVNTTDDKTLTWDSSNMSVATIDQSGKVTAVGLGTTTITVTTSNGKTATATIKVVEKIPYVTYRTHVEDYGWQSYVKDGTMSGTEGEAKRLEGINIKIDNLPCEGGVEYRTHIEDYGWENVWKKNDAMSGTSGEAKRLEAIQINLTGEIAEQYDIYYRVHAEVFGWLDWAKNGEKAGTAGYAYRLEGIEIRLVEKGEAAPGKTTTPYQQKYVRYQTHVEDYGWQGFKYDGATSGTSGEAKRLEGINIALELQEYAGSVEYRTHIEDYGWEKEWKKDGVMSGTNGEAKRLEAIQIRLTGEMANHYDIYYRVHAENFGWLGWAKNGEMAGTAGYAYRLEGIQILLIKKCFNVQVDTTNSFYSI